MTFVYSDDALFALKVASDVIDEPLVGAACDRQRQRK